MANTASGFTGSFTERMSEQTPSMATNTEIFPACCSLVSWLLSVRESCKDSEHVIPVTLRN